MQPYVNISISSQTGMGKSTIAQVVYEALTAAGFDVAISDLDEMNFDSSQLSQRLSAMVSRHTPIVIRTEQVNRGIATPKFKTKCSTCGSKV